MPEQLLRYRVFYYKDLLYTFRMLCSFHSSSGESVYNKVALRGKTNIIIPSMVTYNEMSFMHGNL